MTHILHLGHQPTDISGVEGRISTSAAAFDADLDVNGLIFTGHAATAYPCSFGVAEPAGDLWVGFRYRSPSTHADSIIQANAGFLAFFDGNNLPIARVKPLTSTHHYHAIADGDTSVQGGSSF